MDVEKMSALNEALNLAEGAIKWVPLDGPIRDGYSNCVGAARAELSAIREEIHTRGVTIDHLSAENARMREALEELIAADDAWWSSVGAEGNTTALERMDDARTLARAALGGRDE